MRHFVQKLFDKDNAHTRLHYEDSSDWPPRAGKISPCCPLEIARFDPSKECIYEIFGQYRRLSLRKHERLLWVYGATDEVGFTGSGNKND